MRMFVSGFLLLSLASGVTLATEGHGQRAIPFDLPTFFPSLVSVTRNGVFMCSASIICPDWVLTAAYCVPVTDGLTVLAGNTQTVSVEDTIVHEEYTVKNGKRTNDIAILKLTEPLQFNSRVQPADRPDDRFAVNSKNCWVTCDNLSEQNFGILPRPQNQYVKVIPYTDCNAPQTNVCIEDEKKISVCMADYGRVLVCINDDGSVNPVGIFSYFVMHGPVVYSKISEYIDWIDFHTR